MPEIAQPVLLTAVVRLALRADFAPGFATLALESCSIDFLPPNPPFPPPQLFPFANPCGAPFDVLNESNSARSTGWGHLQVALAQRSSPVTGIMCLESVPLSDVSLDTDLIVFVVEVATQHGGRICDLGVRDGQSDAPGKEGCDPDENEL